MRQLFYAFEAGETSVSQARTAMSIVLRGPVLGKMSLQMPAICMTMKTLVSEVMDDGSARVMSQVLDTSIDGVMVIDDGGLDLGIADDDDLPSPGDIDKELASIRGCKSFGVYDRSGRFTAGVIDAPEGFPQETLAEVQRLHKQFEAMRPLPEGDVVVGTTWGSGDTQLDSGGVTMTIRTTSTVSSMQDDIINISITGEILNFACSIHPEIRVDEFRGSVSGHKTVNLRSAVPVEFSMEVVVIGSDKDGFEFEFRTSTTTALAGQA